MTKSKADTYFTADEAAEYLRISRRSLDRCANSTDPHERIPKATYGTKKLYRRQDLDAWFDRHVED